MEVIVDAREKMCPQPVIMTKKALDSTEKGLIIILVDNNVARDDVEKLVKSQNLKYTIEDEARYYKIIVSKDMEGMSNLDLEKVVCQPLKEDYILLVSRNVLGDGDEELGKLLLENYLYTLLEVSCLPSSILFVNSGVYLTTEDSKSIDTLHKLESRGVEILSCGTCLDFYGLKEKLRVGKVTNMYEIVETTISSRIISL